MTGKVIDISQFNTVADWKKVKSAVDAVIIRLGYRGSIKSNTSAYKKIMYDGKYAEHLSGVKAQGIPYTVYFFPTSITDEEAAEEAAFIIAEVQKLNISLPVFLDSELVDHGNGRADKLSRADRTRLLKVIVGKLTEAGIKCGIYASTSWLTEKLDMTQFSAEVRKNTWVAQYADKCAYTGDYLLWQYTSSGSISGVKGNCDVSKFHGTNPIQQAGKESDPKTKTNTGLLNYAKAQVGLPYWWGCFGQTASQALLDAKLKQYPSVYKGDSTYKSQFGKRVHDCAGLVKGYLWSDTPTSAPDYNAAQDLPASGMYAKASGRGNISSMPEIPGIALYKGDSPTTIHHIGVYGADGYVYEAKGHAYGVVKTSFKKSEWQYWSYVPFIEYPSDESQGVNSGVSAVSGTSGRVEIKTRIRPLKLGDSGKGVKIVQAVVGAKIDGEFGPKTQAAVKIWQSAHGVAATGIVDSATWIALFNSL